MKIFKKGQRVRIKNLSTGHGHEYNNTLGTVTIGNENGSVWVEVKHNDRKSVFSSEKHLEQEW